MGIGLDGRSAKKNPSRWPPPYRSMTLLDGSAHARSEAVVVVVVVTRMGARVR